MSSAAISAILLATVFGFIAPLPLAASGVFPVKTVAAIYGAIFVAIGVSQIGFFEKRRVPQLEADQATSVGTDKQCDDILTLLERADVVIDRSKSPRLVVAKSRWEHLPEAAKDVAVSCVERNWSAATGTAQVEMAPR